MQQEKIYMLSDIFSQLSNQNNIMTLSEVMQRLDNDGLRNVLISVEQGVSESQYKQLKIKIAQANRSIEVESYFDNNIRCDDKLSHKKKSFNTLISDPEPVGENEFRCLLMIDERCAELSDHVTGKHIQLMILVESARQMVNSITEKYYSTNSKIYLANNIDVDFISFVYPFKTEIVYRVNQEKMKVDGNGKMVVSVNFIQWGKIVCHFRMAFTIIDRNFISKTEASALMLATSNKTQWVA